MSVIIFSFFVLIIISEKLQKAKGADDEHHLNFNSDRLWHYHQHYVRHFRHWRRRVDGTYSLHPLSRISIANGRCYLADHRNGLFDDQPRLFLPPKSRNKLQSDVDLVGRNDDWRTARF